MTHTGFSNIANNVRYQNWQGQLGITKIPEALSLIIFRITLPIQENGGKQQNGILCQFTENALMTSASGSGLIEKNWGSWLLILETNNL